MSHCNKIVRQVAQIRAQQVNKESLQPLETDRAVIAAPIGISYYGVICRVFTATVIGVKMSLHVFGH